MPATPNPTQPPPHILVVDDEDDDRRALCNLIKQDGYKITDIASGLEAIELVKQKQIDLVITDLQLADISGWDVLEAIKKDHPKCRVVIMTAQISQQGEAILTSRKADGYLVKPTIPQRARILLKALLSPEGLGREAEVVVLEDKPEILKTIETALGNHGLYVISFQDMRRALRHIKNNPPDLAIVELRLEKNSGFDLCRQIRFTPGIAYMPILVLADKASRELAQRAVRLRVNGLLLKPFQPEDLARRVIHLLRQSIRSKRKI